MKCPITENALCIFLCKGRNIRGTTFFHIRTLCPNASYPITWMTPSQPTCLIRKYPPDRFSHAVQKLPSQRPYPKGLPAMDLLSVRGGESLLLLFLITFFLSRFIIIRFFGFVKHLPIEYYTTYVGLQYRNESRWGENNMYESKYKRSPAIAYTTPSAGFSASPLCLQVRGEIAAYTIRCSLFLRTVARQIEIC